MHKIAIVLPLLFLAAGAVLADSFKTVSFRWLPRPSELGGLSTNDLTTNYVFILFSSTNVTTPQSNWPAIATWPAEQFTNQGPAGSWWTNQLLIDESTRFYLLSISNRNGGASPFSSPAVWVPAPAAGTIRVGP